MSLTISSRPELSLGGFNSRWNAAGGNLPIKYSIFSNLYPVVTTGFRAYASVSSNKGLAQILITSHGFVINQWLLVSGDLYDGIARIVRIVDADNFVIDKPFIASRAGNVRQYYNNYKINIQVYADSVLQGTKAYTPNAATSTVDISDLLQYNLDADRVKEFYIDVFDTYELTRGVITTGSTVSDSANTFYAVYSTLQFLNSRGGNMFDYVIGNGTQAKWMTDFINPVYFRGSIDWNVSIISDTGSFSLDFNQYNDNGDLLASNTVAYSSTNGIFEIDFLVITLNANTTSVVISGTDVQPITIIIDGSTCN